MVLIGLLIYFVFFLIHVSVCLVYPNDMDNEEGFILNQIHQLRTFHTIYPTLNYYPYTVGNYPPVFQLVCVPFSWILGDTHFIGRFISILSSLALGILVYWFVLRLTDDQWSALIAGLFPFAVHFFYRWAPYNRVDMLALLLTFLGVFFIFQNPKSIILPIVLFTLAIFTKQVMVAAPLAAFVYLLKSNKKNAFILLGGVILFNLVIFLFLNGITGGQFFKHTVIYNANPFHWGDVWNYISNLIRFYWIFLILVLISLVFSFMDNEKRLFSIYLVLSSLVALGSGKEGSAVNYWIEFILVGSVLFGIIINKLRKDIYYATFIIPILLLVQIYCIRHVPFTPMWYGTTPRSRDFNIARSVERIVRQTPGFILSDDASLLVRTGKPVMFQPFIMSELVKQNKWNPSDFITDIRAKKFSLVILYFPLNDQSHLDYERYSPPILTALMENYQLVDRRGPYFIHQPK